MIVSKEPNSPGDRELRFMNGQSTYYSHHTETPTVPAYDTVVPFSRGWSPAVSLRGFFA